MFKRCLVTLVLALFASMLVTACGQDSKPQAKANSKVTVEKKAEDAAKKAGISVASGPATRNSRMQNAATWKRAAVALLPTMMAATNTTAAAKRSQPLAPMPVSGTSSWSAMP